MRLSKRSPRVPVMHDLSLANWYVRPILHAMSHEVNLPLCLSNLCSIDSQLK
jgi:hypothetical protein